MKKKGCNPEKLGEKPGVGRQGQDAPWYYESLWGGGRSKKRPQGSLTSNFGHISDHGAPTNWFCSSLWHPCFFTDSSTAWYINQHKSTFTPCFIHRKKNSLSLSLSLSLHNMWNRFLFGALQVVGPHLPTSGASAALAAARPLLLGRGWDTENVA